MRITITLVLALIGLVQLTHAQDYKKGSLTLQDGTVKTGKVQRWD